MNDQLHIDKPGFDVDALFERISAAETERATRMPSETDAIKLMWDAHRRLKELGWKEINYCPKDGTTFLAIEAGSTGIFHCHYSGEWPKGGWWVEDAGDLWPSRPILFKLKTDKPNEDTSSGKPTPSN